MIQKVLKSGIICLLMLLLSLPVSAEVFTSKQISGEASSVFVRGNDDFYPIEYYNTMTEQYEGVMPEILKTISERSGIDFTYIKSGEAEQANLAENLQAEMVSAYLTDSEDAFAVDKITVLSYDDNGKNINIGFAFTDIADRAVIDTVKAEVAKITESDINGYFVSVTNVQSGICAPLLLLSIVCCVLFAIIIVLSALRMNSMKKQSKSVRLVDLETGIGNFVYFEQQFENLISDFSRSLYYIAYIIIDSNYLQLYHGNTAFTDVVRYTADVLTSHARHNEIAARISESGFAFAFQSTNAKEAEQRIEAVIHTLNSHSETDEKNNKPIFRAALYNLKTTDRNCEILLFNLRRNCNKIMGTDTQIALCDARMMNRAMEEKMLVENFTKGFKNQEFKMYLQFIVDNKSHNIVSAEALSRWENPEKGIISPAKYIEAMESVGLITKLDFYMFEMVCRQLEKWEGTDFAHLSISCNFTRITISEDDFIDRLKEISQRYHFNKAKLIIEITEDAIEKNREKATNNVLACKKMGFTIALDDMGSGYTSLSNLCDYPIDIVKIDRDILQNTVKKNGKELFDGIIALAHSLNLKVVCEGVETKEQNELVAASNCDYIQGWYYSRVFPVKESEGFILQYLPK